MSENDFRNDMVKVIIAQHRNAPLTVDGLREFFPPDFDLGDDDLAPYQPIEFEAEAEPTPRLEMQAEPIKTEVVPVAAAEPTPAPTPEAIEAATLRRIASDQNLANARVAVTVAGNAERAARAKLAEAVNTFQKGFPPVTREKLVGDFVKEQAEIRRKIASGEMEPRKNPGIGKSVVDRTAFYGRGGNAARSSPTPWGLNGKVVPAGTPGAVPGFKGYQRVRAQLSALWKNPVKLPSER
jgi:hypothetical protein